MRNLSLLWMILVVYFLAGISWPKSPIFVLSHPQIKKTWIKELWYLQIAVEK